MQKLGLYLCCVCFVFMRVAALFVHVMPLLLEQFHTHLHTIDSVQSVCPHLSYM